MKQEDREKVIITRMVNKLIAFQDKKELRGGCHYFSLFIYYWLQKKYKIMLTPVTGQLRSIIDGNIVGNHSWLEFKNKKIDPTAYFTDTNATYAQSQQGDLILFDRIIRKGSVSYDYISELYDIDNDKLNNEAVRARQLIKDNDMSSIIEYLKAAPGALFSQTRKALS